MQYYNQDNDEPVCLPCVHVPRLINTNFVTSALDKSIVQDGDDINLSWVSNKAYAPSSCWIAIYAPAQEIITLGKEFHKTHGQQQGTQKFVVRANEEVGTWRAIYFGEHESDTHLPLRLSIILTKVEQISR
jgi:hypothetical protein